MNKNNDSIIIPNLNRLSLTDSVINFGRNYMSLPYRFGGNTPAGFDCSGFTSYVFRNFGYELNRSSRDQASQFSAINKQELQIGDLVFFEGYRHNGIVGHVGIVTETKPNGEFNFIHSSIKRGVTISSSEEQYYGSRYVKGGRVLNTKYTVLNPATDLSLYKGKNQKKSFSFAQKKQETEVVEAIYHKVKKGETIFSISKDYDVPVSTIKYLNNLKNEKIKKGKNLLISEAVKISDEPSLAQIESTDSHKILPSESSKVIVADVTTASESSRNNQEIVLSPKSRKSEEQKSNPKPIIEKNTNSSTSDEAMYKVKAGETLYSIAKRYNLSLEKLKNLNNLMTDNISPGQLLAIKSSENEMSSTISTSANTKTKQVSHAVSSQVTHVIKKGETLYSLSRQYGCTVNQLLEWNKNLKENLQIGDRVKILK